MATPSYQGLQQMTASSSWFGSWLNATPAYAGAGQSAPAASMFGSTAPAYKPAPVKPAVGDSELMASDDSDACAPTAFAIVVPRQ